MSLLIPSYKNGFARCAAESENRGIWKGVQRLWAPDLGPTGLTLFDQSGYGKNGTFDAVVPPVGWVTLANGWGVDFDNTDHINITAFASTPTNWTVLAIGDFTPDLASTRRIGMIGQNVTTHSPLHLREDGTMAVYGGGSNVTWNVGDPAITGYHVWATTKNGTSYDAFVDGVSQGAQVDAVTAIDWTVFAEICDNNLDQASDHFTLHLLVLYDRVVPQSQIAQFSVDPHALTRQKSKAYATAVAPGVNAPTGHLYGPLVGPLGGAI